MIIGVVKERKDNEHRVGLTPVGAAQLKTAGAEVWVEEDAGIGSGLKNETYQNAGAKLESDRRKIYDSADMIIKVKEPQKDEIELYREGQTLYTYLHLAADKELTEGLNKRGVTGIAYETITDDHGGLPLLVPMSEVAGRMSVQVGATYLQKTHGGKGVLLGGVPGVQRGQVTIIGGGIVGQNALKIAVGMGAEVRILDIDSEKLIYLDDIYGNRITTLYSNPENIRESLKWADLVVGAVLIPGAKAPKLVTKDMLQGCEEGSVWVDVAVDQGGCFETTKPTSYAEPTYVVDGITHYCVANIPGTVARTSTYALTNVTLPFAVNMAKYGIEEVIKNCPQTASGVNTYQHKIVCEPVARAHDLEYTPLSSLIT